ncbi:uncharacterized protein LAJ45_09042 [Morchella importuna]|uniref:uncharacterized protein n=1 Tax=Morchella importuna TaxID=1174673 RepID=UPI001E8D25C2|nr:uncharacterized protein LAJ45_09042 [Morchella importuna]KAH8146961.1 hypothetical protein LAJ45_09042 [Morchella importuna]
MQVSAIKEIIRRHHHHHAPRNSKNTEKKIPRNRHISALPFDVDGLLLFSIIHHTVTLLSTLSLLRISIIILSAANTCRSTTLIEIPLITSPAPLRDISFVSTVILIVPTRP